MVASLGWEGRQDEDRVVSRLVSGMVVRPCCNDRMAQKAQCGGGEASAIP